MEIRNTIQEKIFKKDLEISIEDDNNKETVTTNVYNFKQIKIGDSRDCVIKK